MPMHPNLIYFLSVVIGAALSYLINQLPGVPEWVKPWLWLPVILLMVLSSWILIRQSSLGQPRRQTTVKGNIVEGDGSHIHATDAEVVGNTLEGDHSRIHATDAEVADNQLTGPNTEISTNDGTSGSGQKP